jgi:hypothetical protein
MDKVRDTRRRYLHLLSVDDQQIAADAVRTLGRTISISSKTGGQKIEDGAIKLRPEILRYLAEHGQATVNEPTAPNPTPSPEGGYASRFPHA